MKFVWMAAFGLAGGLAAFDSAWAQDATPPVEQEAAALAAALPLLENPVWVRGPADIDLEPFYPMGVENPEPVTLVLECNVLVDGGLRGCAVAGGAAGVEPFVHAAQRILFNLDLAPLAPPAATDGEKTVEPIEPVARVRIPFVWAPPVDRAASAARLVPATAIDPPEGFGPDSYPERAQSRGIDSGFARVRCVVTAEGVRVGCVIAQEQPPGAGFGQAAIAIARRRLVTPSTLDGQPITDFLWTSVQFSMTEPPSEPAAGGASAP